MTVLQTEKSKLIKVLSYQDHGTGKSSTMVNLANDGQVTFTIPALTLAQSVVVFVYQSTTSSGGSAVAAHYQKASTGTQNLSELDGAYTVLTTSGVTMTTSTDNYKLLAVTVRASDLTAGYKWVGIVTTSSSTGNLVGDIVAIVTDARFGQAIPPSVQ